MRTPPTPLLAILPTFQDPDPLTGSDIRTMFVITALIVIMLIIYFTFKDNEK